MQKNIEKRKNNIFTIVLLICIIFYSLFFIELRTNINKNVVNNPEEFITRQIENKMYPYKHYISNIYVLYGLIPTLILFIYILNEEGFYKSRDEFLLYLQNRLGNKYNYLKLFIKWFFRCVLIFGIIYIIYFFLTGEKF